MTTATSLSPPIRKMSTPRPIGPPVYCACGRSYREVRRRSAMIGYQLEGTTETLNRKPVCACSRPIVAREMRKARPLHPCPCCNADLGLEDFADAARESGFCHHCAATCPRCQRKANRREIAAAGGICSDCEGALACPSCSRELPAAEAAIAASAGNCGRCGAGPAGFDPSSYDIQMEATRG